MQDQPALSDLRSMNRGQRRKMSKLMRVRGTEKSQANETQAYQAWRKSGDTRADSITFKEFQANRPDQNHNYVPARWATWAAPRLAPETLSALDVEALIIDRDPEQLDPDDRGPYVAEEDVASLMEPQTALDFVVQLAAEEHGGIDAALNAEPVKKQRKPRAKKPTAVEPA